MADLVVPAPLWRRLGAAFYDALLLAAVWIVAVALELAVLYALGIPRNGFALRAYLFIVGLLFFGWFWTHGGQTLGMRAWRLRLRRVDGAPVGWLTAAVRYALAWPSWLLVGAGLAWCLIDRNRRSWHDIGSGTEVVVISATDRAASSRAAP
jgi:uncharacterized RDD family membrane protein YckC